MLTADRLLSDRMSREADTPDAMDTLGPPGPCTVLSGAEAASNFEDFAQVLTHRLRNLLAGIEGFTGLLTDTLGTKEQRELALRILEGTARIEFVLADLQRFSQPLNVVHHWVRLGDLVEHLLAVLGDAGSSRLTLGVQEPERSLTADPLLLSQALLLLLQNALEAGSHRQSVALHTAFEDDTGRLRFDVWNEGIIDLGEATARIFEPFFTTKAHNLGIGLTLARRIAEAHGGTLDLTANTSSKGTCFTLQIPLHGPDPAP